MSFINLYRGDLTEKQQAQYAKKVQLSRKVDLVFFSG